MRKLLCGMVFVLMTALGAQAQSARGNNDGRRAGRGEAMERIHAMKMVYITDRLHLSSAQSGDFMPVYREYEGEMKSLRRSYFKKYKGMDMGNADDATARQYVDDNLDYQANVISLKRKYNDRFMKVLSPQQLAELNKAEREFIKMLKQKREQKNRQMRR
ncbi:MAG: hypothetical protein V4649_16335 [Bacteroidota bacterium]